MYILWSARHAPWTLVRSERFDDYRTARMREIELKAQKSGRGFLAQTGLSADQFGPGS